MYICFSDIRKYNTNVFKENIIIFDDNLNYQNDIEIALKNI